MDRLAVIGTGVYGQYIVQCLLENGAKVDWYDVSKDYVKAPVQQGGVFQYSGFLNGRRFGIGGTAKIWGGQIFSLDKGDGLYSSNRFYQNLVTSDESIAPNLSKKYPGLAIKQGFWLFPWRKNNVRKILKHRNIRLYSGYELKSHHETEEGVFLSFRYKENIVNKVYHRTVYVACGALANGKYFFGDFQWKDHISIPLFRLKGDVILNNSVSYKITHRGLKTWRLHFPEVGVGHYVHFVYNEKSVIKDLIRRLITSKSKVPFTAKRFIVESFAMLAGLLKGRFANLENEFIIMLDYEGGLGSFKSIENIFEFELINGHEEFVQGIKDKLKSVFTEEGLTAIELPFSLNKYEDIYHPFDINPPLDFQEYKNVYGKVLRIDTGLLASCGSTNPTGVLFPFIKTLIENESYN